jgi:hypothetical protein
LKLFHVTFASSVSQILSSGIQTGKSQIWFKKGTGLFPRGFIFAFTDYGEAAKWASRQSLHTSRSSVIIAFKADLGNWIKDENPENVPECLGEWIKSDRAVLPRDILEVVCQARWMLQLDEEYANLPPQERINAWSRFCTHLSAISQLFILSDDDSGKRP